MPNPGASTIAARTDGAAPIAPAGTLSRVALLLMAVLLFFEVASYGAVEAWSEHTALVISGLLVVTLILRHVLDRNSGPPSTWLWAPLCLFLLLAAFQAAPLPADLTSVLAPFTLERKQELLGGRALTHASISYYPRETWRLLRMMLVGAALFAASITLGRERGGVTRLLMLVFAAGCGEALFALAQQLVQADWSYSLGGRAARRLARTGTFVNYSNFSQFINLAIGAGLSLLLVRSERRRRLHGRPDSWDQFWKAQGWIVAGLSACCLAVLASMSRNGVLSLFVAGAAFLLLLNWRRAASAQAWALLAVPVAAFAGLGVLGLDVAYDRMGSLADASVYTDRWRLALDTLRAWRDHPVWGIGLSAHEYVFSSYDTTGARAIAQTADNDYAQILEETGVVGVTLIGVFVGGLIAVVYRLLKHGRRSESLAAFGLSYGLIAVAVHSLSDFGQRVPAVFSLTAICCGLLVAAERSERPPGETADGRSHMTRRWGAMALAAVLMPVWAVALAVAAKASQAERAWAKAYYQEQKLAANDWLGSVDEYQRLLEPMQTAASLEPNNARYAHLLNRYRWQAMLRAGAGETLPDTTTPEFQGVARAIADELASARQLCPTFGPLCALEGKLRSFVLGEAQEGERLIRLGVELAPQDPDALFTAGLFAAQHRDLAAARRCFERLVYLDASYFPHVAEQLAIALDSPDSADALARDEVERWDHLAKLYDEHEALRPRVAGVEARVVSLLERRLESGRASPRDVERLARAARERGNDPQAIALAMHALASDYSNIGLRLWLAERLAAAGKIEEALHEAKICQRLRPGDAHIGKVIETLYARARRPAE